jgi:iron complex transport system substrate-binding protein
LRNRVRFWRLAVAGTALTGALFLGATSRAQNPLAQPVLPALPSERTPAVKSPQSPAPLQNVPLYREVLDETGRTVRVPQPVERIVSLAPSMTETVYALGLQDRLVGDTEYCDYPPEAQNKPKVGGAVNPSIELVASMRPDLVLVTKSLNRFETVRALDELKIPSYATDPHNVQEIISSTSKLAEVLGAASAGSALAEDLRQRLQDLQHRIGELPARRVLFVVWTDPLITIGKDTFIADALRKAGGVSIVDSTQDWPQLSLEEVVRLQPEFLVFAAQHEENVPPDLLAVTARPGWRSLEAVRNRKFAVISDAVNRPAPRIVSAIEELARQLHPEAFEDMPSIAPSVNGSKPEGPAPDRNPPPGAAKQPFAATLGSKLGEVCVCAR